MSNLNILERLQVSWTSTRYFYRTAEVIDDLLLTADVGRIPRKWIEAKGISDMPGSVSWQIEGC